MHVSYDCLFHMNRLVGIVDALRDRQFLPKLYPYTNNGYGYASPLFYCDLFLYPFALLYWIGVPLVICYKLMIAFYTLFSIIGIFYIGKKIFRRNKLTPYLLTIIYTFCNYRLYDVYERGALGEIIAFAFIPWIIYAIYKIFMLKQDSWILLGISFACTLMSHNITFALCCMSFSCFIVGYVILNRKNKVDLKKRMKSIIKAIALALSLTAWYLLPMIEQFLDQKFVVNGLKNIYNLSETALPISAIFNPFAMLDRLEKGRFAVINIGWILLITPITYLFKKEKNKYLTMAIVFAYILLMIMTGVGINMLESITFIQFLFRLYIIIFPIMSFAVAYIFDNWGIEFQRIFIVAVIVYSIFNACLIQYECLNKTNNLVNEATRESLFDFNKEIGYRDHNGLEISGGEYLPITEKVDYLEETTFIKEITKDGYIDYIFDFNRNFTKIGFEAESDSRKLIMLPQTYYKGYQAYKIVNGNPQEIETINVPEYKKVGIYIDAEYGEYYCEYKGTNIQNISLFISAISLVYTICAIIKYSENHKSI